jgi:hypothetical protein
MPSDERDAMFEKALARQLHGDGSRELGNDAATTNCPDAGILAAYHEQTLSAEEMAQFAMHLAGCGHCRGILSLLAATDGIPLTAGEDVAGEPSRAATVAPIVMPAPKRSARREIRYWAAPLGAMAAVLLLWVAVRHQKEVKVNQTAGTAEVALNREDVPLQEIEPPTPFPEADKTGSASPEAGAELRDGMSARKKESAGGDQISRATKDSPSVNAKLAAPRAMPSSTPTAKSAAPAIEGSGSGGRIGAGIGGAGAGSAGAKMVAPQATTESVEVSAAAPNFDTQTSAPASSAPPPAGPRVPAQNQSVIVQEAAPANAAAKAKAGESGAYTTSAQSLEITGRNVTDLVMLNIGVVGLPITAPGGDILWRTGRAGRIETSKDRGAHWKKQKSHVKVDLSSGSAPAAEVCWIVGGAGTILRTTDGGAHWKKVASPISGEIAGIGAADAQHATVWDATRSSNFVTADGGITWSPVANQ